MTTMPEAGMSPDGPRINPETGALEYQNQPVETKPEPKTVITDSSGNIVYATSFAFTDSSSNALNLDPPRDPKKDKSAYWQWLNKRRSR